MLQSYELRKDNWILSFDPNEGEKAKRRPCRVSWRHLRAIEVEQKDNYSPILLTKDILERSGWKATDGQEVYYHEKFGDYLVVKKGDEGYIMEVAFQEAQIGEPMLYLHQLQNRYYGLVFEEMTVEI
jgi:hypothetical protein